MEVYLVGGAVRDKLLGRPVKERDYVVVGTTPANLLAQGYRPVGKDFPVFLHPQTQEEYALARTERKTGPGYKGFEVDAAPDVTLEEDLQRRDLTINAIAEAADGSLLDPFGGQQDLARGILRHVSPAFAEDPVRILRAARFAARFNFKVAPETLALMEAMVTAGEADHLVPERVWRELERALGESYPRRFFEILRACGALARIFPEIECLFGVPQPRRYHPEIDTGIHTLKVLEIAAHLSSDTQVRFAALTHDLGKGQTPSHEWPHHYGHGERGVALVLTLCQRLRVPKAYQALAVQVARYHNLVHQAQELRPGTILKLLNRVDAFRRPSRFEQFLLACEADARGRSGLENRPYPQANQLRLAFRAAAAVTARPLVAAGLRGEAIAEQLQQQRIKAIKQAVHTERG
ncbi:multifunctional CCA addition/repair protein [Nitrosococcus oceani]|uniref:Multifunctional CCA protein n=2 Tax=Nitrosococcus oceani TaxID=1229 RepID=CCA_NITOC|nr:multifunctional CCA addition/repair protein [Nitrosococcus oceani]Q3JE31.1 RecName: Full=Multifunctional CCA protein; Includes: RecName: Full=CCA-adding enzyme; AltName: Full=CCA tRNA nucleotidyltransferase; AltName: Full=tRNA CCA-pyrophosphorylase; AltName: Full=tRNA adenylyl-/cytidylyl-transferase; AltName: Full=tRNA nucleotidyltransferase; AltName: Full=tRNA-NT; Includes: RecName: Full=2'-nucleotidase; Includes: RecName: Full=2',3'-cyclic phosphodiesterase; Includes: RecName: Full=Phosphatas